MLAPQWLRLCTLRQVMWVCCAFAAPTLGLAETAITEGDAPPDVCAAAKTQGEMIQCAFDDFLQASSAYAASQAAFSKRQMPAQRSKLLRTQSAWLKYRTAACEFESSAVEGGSLKPFVNWRCAARMTRERAAEVSRLAACGAGDAACARPRW